MIRKPTKIELRQEDDYYEYEEYKRKQQNELRNKGTLHFTQKSSVERSSLIDSSFKVDSFKGFSSPGNLSSPQDIFSANMRHTEQEFQETANARNDNPSQFNQIFSLLLISTMGGSGGLGPIGQSPLPGNQGH